MMYIVGLCSDLVKMNKLYGMRGLIDMMDVDLPTLYYLNAENDKSSHYLRIAKVDNVTGEITNIKNIPFPVGGQLFRSCSYNTKGNITFLYWRLRRVKPLLFDAICLKFKSHDVNLITSCKIVGHKDLFNKSFSPICEFQRLLSAEISSLVLNTFQVSRIFNESIDDSPERFKTVFLKFLKAGFNSPTESVNSNRDLFDIYENLVFD